MNMVAYFAVVFTDLFIALFGLGVMLFLIYKVLPQFKIFEVEKNVKPYLIVVILFHIASGYVDTLIDYGREIGSDKYAYLSEVIANQGQNLKLKQAVQAELKDEKISHLEFKVIVGEFGLADKESKKLDAKVLSDTKNKLYSVLK